MWRGKRKKSKFLNVSFWWQANFRQLLIPSPVVSMFSLSYTQAVNQQSETFISMHTLLASRDVPNKSKFLRPIPRNSKIFLRFYD